MDMQNKEFGYFLDLQLTRGVSGQLKTEYTVQLGRVEYTYYKGGNEPSMYPTAHIKFSAYVASAADEYNGYIHPASMPSSLWHISHTKQDQDLKYSQEFCFNPSRACGIEMGSASFPGGDAGYCLKFLSKVYDYADSAAMAKFVDKLNDAQQREHYRFDAFAMFLFCMGKCGATHYRRTTSENYTLVKHIEQFSHAALRNLIQDSKIMFPAKTVPSFSEVSA